MTKLKKAGIFTVIATLATCLVVSLMLSFTAFATGELRLADGASSLTGFAYGQTIEMPSGSLEFNGETKRATVSVIYPNGKVDSEGVVTLDVEGVYTVEYKATFTESGQQVEKTLTQTFTVRKNLYNMTSKDSSYSYGTYYYEEHNLGAGYQGNAEDAITMNESTVTGVQISLAMNDTLTYGKIIDLSGATKDDKIIQLAITPSEIGARDVNDFSIILTDAYDVNNFVTITVKAGAENSISYMFTSASSQQPTGFNYNAKLNDDGSRNNSGSPLRVNLAGPYEGSRNYALANKDSQIGMTGIDKNQLSVSIDYATKSMYNTTSGHGANNQFTVDLDDPVIFSKLWGGFTTGECFLSIKGGTYSNSTFNFVITEIMGDVIDNDFVFTDRGELEIDVDTDKFTTLPNGKVNVPYKVFDASCFNVYFGDLPVTAKVTNSQGAEVSIVNGAFTPTEAGEYTITYTATDYFGETNTKELTITVAETVDGVTANYNGTYATSGVAGVTATVADVTTSGGSGGPIDVVATVKLGTEDVRVVDGTFFPEKVGTYKVTLTASDYIGQTAVLTYDYVVSAGTRPVFIERPTMPRYLISGVEYELPKVNAYDYTDGSGVAKIIAPKIAYVDSRGTNLALGGKISPVADEYKKTVDIIYYTDEPIKADYNLVFENIPLVDISGDEGYDLTKLLVGSGFTATPYVNFTKLEFNRDIEFDFVNAVGANGLEIRFTGSEAKTNYAHVAITLTDSENSDEQVKFYYSPYDTEVTLFRINSTTAVAYEAKQSLKTDDTLALVIDTSTKTVKFDRNSSLTPEIATYLNGKPFNGFTTNKVYVTIEVLGVTQDAEFSIRSIAGQALSYLTIDAASPIISIEGEYLGYRSIGDKVRIPKALITDAIDPSVKGTVTVTAPTSDGKVGAYVQSDEGLMLNKVPCDKDYYITVSKYGNYLVTFYAKDASGNELNYQYFIGVMDETAPQIKFSGKNPTTGKVNKTVSLKKATATDDVDGDVEVEVYLETTTGLFYKLDASAPAFKPDRAGLYRVMYSATDLSGNIAFEIVEVTVS